MYNGPQLNTILYLFLTTSMLTGIAGAWYWARHKLYITNRNGSQKRFIEANIAIILLRVSSSMGAAILLGFQGHHLLMAFMCFLIAWQFLYRGAHSQCLRWMAIKDDSSLKKLHFLCYSNHPLAPAVDVRAIMNLIGGVMASLILWNEFYGCLC